MDEIRLEARAKINLGLDVLRRREDGYHEVKMVMQTVDIRDVLRFRKLEEDGMEVVMTREEDVMLSDGDADNKKLDDLNSRIGIINEQQPAIAVSIHQNSYSDPAVRGAQVFYFTHSDKGKQAAEALQKELLEFDQENTRDIKANDTYYLLKKTEVPTVIVECGFLSCPGEAELLTDEAYQEELAVAIAKGIESWVVK